MDINTTTSNSIKYNQCQLYGLVVLRVLIGWHFLYEGISKLTNPYWTSAAFLMESKWVFSGWAEAIVANPSLVTAVDFLNMWGLTAIGLGLICGCFLRWASIAGMVLLGLYYVVNPPFIGFQYSAPTEGSYLIVNKNLIEMCALYILTIFPTSSIIGIDRLIFNKNPENKS
jgi:thiosulfate dehydrogenase [quinone] large subunit